MSILSRLVLLCILALGVPPAWADDTAGTAAAPASTGAQTAAAAPTAPFLMAADKISAGDTAWMLTSTALVLMMCVPGLALFYGGMVRKKNVLATLMQSFACCCVVTLLWWVIGYSWAFTPGNGFIGGSSRAFFNGMTFITGDSGNKLTVSHLALTIPETVYAMFQMTFAIITPALIAGAFADRMKFSAMLVFLSAWSLLVYVPIAHMVWEPTGWLNAGHVLDYAGGTVVHINAGIAGLASCLVLGKRLGYGKEAMPAAQSDPDAHRSVVAMGRLVRFQCGLSGRRGWARRHGDVGHADGDRRGSARVDVCGVDQQGEAQRLRDCVRCGRGGWSPSPPHRVSSGRRPPSSSGWRPVWCASWPPPRSSICSSMTIRWTPSVFTVLAASSVRCSPACSQARKSAAWTAPC